MNTVCLNLHEIIMMTYVAATGATINVIYGANLSVNFTEQSLGLLPKITQAKGLAFTKTLPFLQEPWLSNNKNMLFIYIP